MNSPRKRPGLLFMLVAPAGAGKNSLMQHVLRLTTLTQLPTATTRAIRAGEQEGREHLYVSVETFKRMIDDGELLEHQIIHGNLYGMPLKTVEDALDSGKAIIADIEVLGATIAREHYPENVICIFIQPPSIGTLIERMRDRRENEAEIGKRLLRVPMEMRYAASCNYVVINDQFDQAADLLYRIVQAELNGERGSETGDTLIPFHFGYSACIIPVFEGETLRRTSEPHSLSTTFTEDVLPHLAALRCLRHELHLDAREAALTSSDRRDGEYVPPVTLEYRRDGDKEHVDYNYIYCLEERIAAPEGWEWVSCETLPEALRPAVAECAP